MYALALHVGPYVFNSISHSKGQLEFKGENRQFDFDKNYAIFSIC